MTQNKYSKFADAFIWQFRRSPLKERRHILDVSLPFLIGQAAGSPLLETRLKELRDFLEGEYRSVMRIAARYGMKTVRGANIVFMPGAGYEALNARINGNANGDYIFVNRRMNRRKIGRAIRKGLRYFKGGSDQ